MEKKANTWQLIRGSWALLSYQIWQKVLIAEDKPHSGVHETASELGTKITHSVASTQRRMRGEQWAPSITVITSGIVVAAHLKGSGLLKRIWEWLGNQGSRDLDGRFDCEIVHLSVHHSSHLWNGICVSVPGLAVTRGCVILRRAHENCHKYIWLQQGQQRSCGSWGR